MKIVHLMCFYFRIKLDSPHPPIWTKEKINLEKRMLQSFLSLFCEVYVLCSPGIAY